jgi:hypothetical protein
VLYKFVRDRQDGSDLDFDLDLEQNSNKTLTTKTRSNNRVALNNRTLPQTVAMNNLSEQQTTMFAIEKKEFDYDFVSLIFSDV